MVFGVCCHHFIALVICQGTSASFGLLFQIRYHLGVYGPLKQYFACTCFQNLGTIVTDYETIVEVQIYGFGKGEYTICGASRGKCYAHTVLPMDESLILSAVDISGRSYLGLDLPLPSQRVGDFDTELVEEFFIALARRAGITLHIRQLAGLNSHHIIEGAFKSAGRSLRAAVAIDPDCAGEIPSTKGVL